MEPAGRRSLDGFARTPLSRRRQRFDGIREPSKHGKALAAGSHRLSPGRSSDRLLTRLADNEGVLTGVCSLLTTAVQASRRIPPAGEWLLDNFYLIEEQIRMARRHLPKGYSRELPCLLNGASGGLPRVYDIALEIISHGDGHTPRQGSGLVPGSGQAPFIGISRLT